MNNNFEEHRTRKSKWPIIISGIVLSAIVLSFFLVPGVNNFIKEAYTTLTSEDETKISNWVDSLGIWEIGRAHV